MVDSSASMASSSQSWPMAIEERARKVRYLACILTDLTRKRGRKSVKKKKKPRSGGSKMYRVKRDGTDIDGKKNANGC